MARNWTPEEYRQTDAIYDLALRDRRRGAMVDRADVLAQAATATGRADGGSLRMHFGNLTAARRDLGLAVLPEFPPLGNYPPKLAAFLAGRYRTREAAQS